MTALLLLSALALAEPPVSCADSPVPGCVETVQVDDTLVEAEALPADMEAVTVDPLPPPPPLSARQRLYYGIVDGFIWAASYLVPEGHVYQGAMFLADKLMEALAAAATGLLFFFGMRQRRSPTQPQPDTAALKRARQREQLLQEQNNLLRSELETMRTSFLHLGAEVQASRAAALRTAGHEV